MNEEKGFSLRQCAPALFILLLSAGCVAQQRVKKDLHDPKNQDKSPSVRSIRWDTTAAIGNERSISFTRTPTRNVLSAVEIWYRARVNYESSDVPYFEFTGKINSETEITTVLQIMHYQCNDLHLKYDPSLNQVTVLRTR